MSVAHSHHALCVLHCPSAQKSVFESLSHQHQERCLFRYESLAPRDQLPPAWFERFAFGLVHSGTVIRQRIDANGNATSVDIACAGALLPLHWPLSHTQEDISSSGYAVSQLNVCLLPLEWFEKQIDSNHQIEHDLLRLQSEAMERMERLGDARNRGSVQEKLATLLCALADTLKLETLLPEGLQQKDLAVLLGARHETVCRVLKDFEQRGAILRSKDGMQIDRALLMS
ncbi:MAG: Crp/Fnr family transcriptional regulator [Myxococcales bacterium]|nr:MAG: Crp/Fnr family transcriptional regulator [Myxococcales bacterium]